MVHPVHESFFRIGMGDVIGRFIISAYLCLYREVLRKKEAATLTSAQMECFAGSIMVYASHSMLHMRTTAYRTDFYCEFIHRTFCKNEAQSEPTGPHYTLIWRK